jgi:glycosyltransferase 2 family protein
VLLLRVGVSAALIGWLATRVDFAAVGRQLGTVGAENVLAILVLQFMATGLKSYKWQQLLAADGIHLSHPAAFASYMVGTFFSLFLPTSIGGDAVRAVDAGRMSGRPIATVTSVAADRVLGFAAIGIVGLLALAAGSASLLRPELRMAAAVLYLAVLGTSAFLFTGWLPRLARLVRLERVVRLDQPLAAVAESVAAYRRSGRLVRWTLVSVGAQVIVVVAVWMIARSLAIGVPLSYFFVIVPLVGLVESVPISVFGIGTRDVSYVYLLGLVGTEQAPALSLSVLYVVLTILYALLGGLVFALRRPAVVAPDGLLRR